jgi:hypothetical protein
MTVFFVKVTKYHVEFVKADRFPIFVRINQFQMKRILAVLALMVFLASCSQYTCPTYSKQAPKKNSEHKI